MATENEHAIPGCVRDAIREAGHEPDMVMQPTVLTWWEWYTAKAKWYDHEELRDGRRYKVRRHTLHPARRVCREWASAILDDDGTKVATDVEAVTDMLEEWVKETRFIPTAQRCLERAFGVGTGALALWFDAKEDGTTDIRARRYDARMVLPLSWDDDGVTACAFVTDAYLDGRKVHQLQIHEPSDETGTYHVATRVFDAESGDELAPDGIIPDFDTLSESPTFAIVRPALDNVHAEGTYMGQSVFADAIDAIKGVDNAFDSMQREINATKVKVFASADMFDVEAGEDGIMRAVPMDPDDLWVVKLDTATADEMYEVFSPTIRTTQLAEALNVGLAELGDLTGFGQDYFRYDKRSGLRTATEVSADNSAFMRNIRKHENELRPQLEALLACLLACQRALNGWAVPEGCGVRVDFDDSIIQDTSAEKAQMLAEVSANVVPRWMYLERFYGMDEEEARRVAGDPEVLDMGA